MVQKKQPAQSVKKNAKRKQPGITELLRLQRNAPTTLSTKADDRDHSEQKRKPGETAALKIFAFRRRDSRVNVRSFFLSSVGGCLAAFPGRHDARRTSASAFWLRCSARK